MASGHVAASMATPPRVGPGDGHGRRRGPRRVRGPSRSGARPVGEPPDGAGERRRARRGRRRRRGGRATRGGGEGGASYRGRLPSGARLRGDVSRPRPGRPRDGQPPATPLDVLAPDCPARPTGVPLAPTPRRPNVIKLVASAGPRGGLTPAQERAVPDRRRRARGVAARARPRDLPRRARGTRRGPGRRARSGAVDVHRPTCRGPRRGARDPRPGRPSSASRRRRTTRSRPTWSIAASSGCTARGHVRASVAESRPGPRRAGGFAPPAPGGSALLAGAEAERPGPRTPASAGIHLWAWDGATPVLLEAGVGERRY